MKKYILAIDEGTSSARAILFDFHANPVAIGRSDFPLYYPQEAWVEQNAMEIYNAQIHAIQECIDLSKIDISEIQAVGITNQRETTVLWDTETGLPVYNAIVWQDRRTTERCEELRKLNLTEKIKNKTGLVPDPYFSATKIEWILNHVPGVKEKAQAGKIKFGTIDTWLLWKLTEGKVHATDVSNASRTLLFNIQNLSWDKELLELFNIPESILPNVCPSAHNFGEMNWQGTKIPILSMIGDQQSATFGQACFDAGSVKNTYGTGCFMLMNTGKNICFSENGLISTIAWQIGSEVTYALEGAIFSAGASVQWLLESGLVQSIEEMTALASGLSDNGDVYLVPAFAGLGAPQWDPTARGCLIGLTRGTTKAHISRAALEGMAFQSDETLSAMRLDSGLKIPKIKVDGGASNNSFLMQFQANISQVNIERPICTETTAMGAAFLAGLQAGVYSTLSDIQNVWKLDQTFDIQQDDNHDRLKKRWQEAVKTFLTLGMKIGILSSASISCLEKEEDFFSSQSGISDIGAKLAESWEKQLPDLKNLDRVTKMAICAARLAVKNDDLNHSIHFSELLKTSQIGVCLGSSRGATESFEKHHREFLANQKISALTSPMTTLGNISSSVAKDLKINGPLLSHSSTCSTGLQAIGNAIAWLSAGMSDYFLAGASEAPLTDFTKAQMKALKIYSSYADKKYPCQPLGKNKKNTMILGESASVFMLEKYQENVQYEAVIESYSNAMDHQVSATGISEEGFYQSMKGVLKNIDANEIDCVLMHAPGTIAGDQAELQAIQKIWKKIPVYSLKWQTGHSLGASGCLSIQLAISMLKNQKFPKFPYPVSIENDNPEKIRKILINAAGFGGNTSSLVVSI